MTWTAGELAAELRHCHPDAEVYIVGNGQVERVRGFGSVLRRGVVTLRRVFGVRVLPQTATDRVFIEGKPL